MLRNHSVVEVPSIGPKRAAVLRDEAGISTIEDLIYYAPRRYLDRSSFLKIIDCIKGQEVTVAGSVTAVRIEAGGRMLAVEISDGSDSLCAVFFGGVRFFQKRFAVGDEVVFSGTVDLYRGRKQISHPEFDFFGGESADLVNTGRIIPLYRSTEALQKAGFSSRGFRKVIFQTIKKFLDHVDDPIPPEIRARLSLPDYAKALRAIHFPDTMHDVDEARMRLAFNELFFLQYYLNLTRRLLRETSGGSAAIPDMRWCMDFFRKLPFELTEDQKQTVNRISQDISQPFEMNRLVQGDVGSGKTLVALMSMLIAIDNGYQTCIMAPTEILAEQHLTTIRNFLKGMNVRVELLTGLVKGKKRQKILQGLSGGEIQILVGTHSIIEDPVVFLHLGLAVIDEQHRFGVKQRAKLWLKGERPPHILVMTATPIPRTLAMTIYGDLDVSVIDELPPGRKPIITRHYYDDQTTSLYENIRKQILLGRQAYIVFPLIKESEKSDLKNLEEGFEALKDIFPEFKLSKVHGKMKSSDKEAEMQKFVNGKTQILVATTVIEVGVNIPNATVMVILDAQRFGLSQLHQLRGRVGRGGDQSFCLLVTTHQLNEITRKRINIMCETNDGFRIAEADLKLRGPGDLEGTQQSGIAFDLKLANIAQDGQIVQLAREQAQKIIDNDPQCDKNENEILWNRLRQLRKTHVNWAAIS